MSFSPNTNTMDPESMPSDKAAAARMKAIKVMNALDTPGEADKLMGKREPKGTHGIIPMDWLKSKFSGKKEKKEGDKVVR